MEPGNDAGQKHGVEMTALNNSDPAPVAVAARFANPGALGLGAFALTTFVLSFANAGWVPGAGGAVLGLALFYGGIGQVIAGIWEFANKNTFAATAFTSYGLFWMAAWFLNVSGFKVDSQGVGIFFLAWGIFTLYMVFAAIKVNVVVLLVFIALTLTFAFLAIGQLANSVNIGHIGGYLGILTAVLAFYGSFATVMNETWKRTVLPLWPAS
jgi:succinate-acetate transporter protein